MGSDMEDKVSGLTWETLSVELRVFYLYIYDFTSQTYVIRRITHFIAEDQRKDHK